MIEDRKFASESTTPYMANIARMREESPSPGSRGDTEPKYDGNTIRSNLNSVTNQAQSGWSWNFLLVDDVARYSSGRNTHTDRPMNGNGKEQHYAQHCRTTVPNIASGGYV